MPSAKSKKNSQSGRIIINVGGLRHETHLSTLRNIPDTRLSSLIEHHSSGRGEYFFDRHPGVFAQILNYYRTGKLHCPNDVCGPLFEEELSFWGIDEQQVETCCWENFKQHKEKQEKLKYFTLPGLNDSCDDAVNVKYPILFDDEEDSWWKRYQPIIWKNLEKPHSSAVAKIIGIISFIVFAAYIIKFSLSTLEHFKDQSTSRYQVLTIIHLIAQTWFTIDFSLRVIFSPDKVAFLKCPYTWTDLSSVISIYVFYFYPGLQKVPFLEMLAMLKVARIFQLFKLSYVLQVLVNTLKASLCELWLLLVFMCFVMLFFATVVYFLERHESAEDFRSVPHSMWWAVITMTTVGYGEVYPRTWLGKIVGSACAICGVLVIALPVSVVASNFSIFYTYVKARLNVPPKKKRVALSHALTSMHSHKSNSVSRNEGSLVCTEDRRNTGRSVAASELSYTSLSPSLQLKETASPHSTLYNSSNHLKPTRNYTSRSLSSLTSEMADTRGITVTLESPTRASSVADISLSTDFRSIGGGLLQVPYGRLAKLKDEDKQNTFRESFASFSRLGQSNYPLHLRRGAVSPSTFSLKSTSTTSSFSQLPRGSRELCNALKSKGPIIVLSEQSLESLNTLQPNLPSACGSGVIFTSGESNAHRQTQSETNLAAGSDMKKDNRVTSNGYSDADQLPHRDDVPRVTNEVQTNASHPDGDIEDSTCTGSSPVSDLSPRENMFLSVPVNFGSRKCRTQDYATHSNTTSCDFFASDSNTRSGRSESETCDEQRDNNSGDFVQKRPCWFPDMEDDDPQVDRPLLKRNGVQDNLKETASQLCSPEDHRALLLNNGTAGDKAKNNVEVQIPMSNTPSNDISTPLSCMETRENYVTRKLDCDGRDLYESPRITLGSDDMEPLTGTSANYGHSVYLETDLDVPGSERTTPV